MASRGRTGARPALLAVVSVRSLPKNAGASIDAEHLGDVGMRVVGTGLARCSVRGGAAGIAIATRGQQPVTMTRKWAAQNSFKLPPEQQPEQQGNAKGAWLTRPMKSEVLANRPEGARWSCR